MADWDTVLHSFYVALDSHDYLFAGILSEYLQLCGISDLSNAPGIPQFSFRIEENHEKCDIMVFVAKFEVAGGPYNMISNIN